MARPKGTKNRVRDDSNKPMLVCEECKSEFRQGLRFARFCGPKCSRKVWLRENADHDRAYRRARDRKPEVRATSKAWASANAEHLREYKHQHYLANKLEYIERATKRSQEKPEDVKRAKKKYAETPAGKEAGYNGTRRRLARKRNAPGSYTLTQFKATCDFYGNVCLACLRSDLPLTADHIVPLAKGGSDSIGNIQPLCQSCNSQKSAKTRDYRRIFYCDIVTEHRPND